MYSLWKIYNLVYTITIFKSMIELIVEHKFDFNLLKLANLTSKNETALKK